MRIKKLLVAFLAFAMLSTGILNDDIHVQADTSNKIIRTDNSDLVVIPGQINHMKIPIQATNKFIAMPSISLSSEAPFTFSDISITINGSKVTGIGTDNVYFLEFDVKVKDSASIKDYTVNAAVSYYEYDTDGAKESCNIAFSFVLKVQDEKAPAQLTVSEVNLNDTDGDDEANLSFTVKNEGQLTAKSIYLTMDYGGVIEEAYTSKNIEVGSLGAGNSKWITLPVTVLSSAGQGKKKLVCNFTYKTADGVSQTAAYNIYVNLNSSVVSTKLIVENVSYKDGLQPGDNFILSLTAKNAGGTTIKNISADIDASSITTDGILKNYYTDGIQVSSIKSDNTKALKFPLTVSKYATGGMKALKVNINYENSKGTSYNMTETVYISVTAATTAGIPNLVISNVKQSPEQPSAGNRVNISFEMENKGNVSVSDIKVYADGLTNATFIPVEAEPYQYITKLKGGDKKRITIPLVVSKNIPEGLNNLTLKYKYTGSEENTVIIPVRNVQNDFGSNSKPKLIVSKYSTDVQELRAGSTFNFTYDIYNTNASVAAKNITVTISQADNIFTVTQGSNSFFINKIDPGETAENTIELRVKSDAVTKAYPLKLTIEYEYDGMEPNKETGESGVKKDIDLNLQAVENARPVADNIQVYSYNGNVSVGNTATLSFEFYNMGKSVLSNVMATLEGDGFTKADGNMYFIGNAEAGSSTLVEFDVIPNKEGAVPGKLKISYEDSNGNTVEFTKDFTGQVMAAGALNTGLAEGGNPTDVNAMNPNAVTAKKAILPVWLFVIIQLIIFAIFVPVTRKVIISAYKSKLRKKEEEQY